MSVRIPIGSGRAPAFIAGQFANRHGLIAGATGTGKSVTLMTLAEGFSRAGVPVFLADVKGDLAQLARGNPVRAVDVFGQVGERLSLRVDSLGPDVMARLLGLSDVQGAGLDIAFALARDDRRPLATLADFRRLLQHIAADHRAISIRYGLVSPASIAATQRALIGLERDGGAELFGAVTYDVAGLLGRMDDGRGVITRLDSVRLMRSPMAYGAALLFILSDLYDRLPEVGDLEAPRLVLFFDEAHLLFADIAPRLLQRIERIIRLIRSKGVGVYFATQSPADVPPVILGQLGNRVQHALRGATLADQRAIRATAETLPINPAIDAYKALASLGVGKALVSTIDESGVPRPVDMVTVYAPRCMSAPASVEPLPRAPGNRAPEMTPRPSARHTLAAAGVIAAGYIAAIGAAVAFFGRH